MKFLQKKMIVKLCLKKSKLNLLLFSKFNQLKIKIKLDKNLKFHNPKKLKIKFLKKKLKQKKKMIKIKEFQGNKK